MTKLISPTRRIFNPKYPELLSILNQPLWYYLYLSTHTYICLSHTNSQSQDVSRSPRKRSHRDVSDSENGDSDIIEIPPPKVTKIIDNKGRPRQKSYDNEVRDVIKLAIDITKVKLVTHNPFPMNAEEEEMIKDSWEQACFQFGVMFGMTLDIYKLVSLLHLSLLLVLIR